MKPYSRAKRLIVRRGEDQIPREERRIRRVELVLASIGIVIATLSMLIAATSSYLSWRQIKIIADEHLTPYRSIYYATKIESYKEIVGVITEYRMAVLHFQNLKNGYITALEKRTGRPSTSDRAWNASALASIKLDDQLVVFAENIDKMHDRYHATLSKNQGVWSPRISKLIDEILNYDTDLCLCSRYLTFKSYRYKDSFIEGMFTPTGEIIEYDNGSVGFIEPPKKLDAATICVDVDFNQGFYDKFEQLTKEMMIELRAEQVKMIG